MLGPGICTEPMAIRTTFPSCSAQSGEPPKESHRIVRRNALQWCDSSQFAYVPFRVAELHREADECWNNLPAITGEATGSLLVLSRRRPIPAERLFGTAVRCLRMPCACWRGAENISPVVGVGSRTGS
jgi:hypothetical protein